MLIQIEKIFVFGIDFDRLKCIFISGQIVNKDTLYILLNATIDILLGMFRMSRMSPDIQKKLFRKIVNLFLITPF